MPKPKPPTADQIARLQQAYDLVMSVYAELKQTKTACECCGVYKYDEPDQWHQRQQLGSAAGRIERVIKWGQKGEREEYDESAG